MEFSKCQSTAIEKNLDKVISGTVGYIKYKWRSVTLGIRMIGFLSEVRSKVCSIRNLLSGLLLLFRGVYIISSH